MITVMWQGKAVSVNKWHCVRNGKISPTREYEEFIDQLAWSIKDRMRGENTSTWFAAWPALNLIMSCELGALADDQNLLKPVCDAIERSGLLENDRDIKTKWILPASRHKRGGVDTIWLHLMEVSG